MAGDDDSFLSNLPPIQWMVGWGVVVSLLGLALGFSPESKDPRDARFEAAMARLAEAEQGSNPFHFSDEDAPFEADSDWDDGDEQQAPTKHGSDVPQRPKTPWSVRINPSHPTTTDYLVADFQSEWGTDFEVEWTCEQSYSETPCPGNETGPKLSRYATSEGQRWTMAVVSVRGVLRSQAARAVATIRPDPLEQKKEKALSDKRKSEGWGYVKPSGSGSDLPPLPTKPPGW